MDPIFIFFLVMLVFMYVLLIRPQRQQAKQEMLGSIEVGDEVVTAGGIYGEVTAIDDERVQLEIDADVRIAVARRAIASKVSPEEQAAMAEEPSEAPEPITVEEPEPVAEEQARR